MAINIKKLFNEELPAAIAKHPDVAKEIGTKYQINITGDGGGEWYIDVSNSGPSCKQGNPGGADCTVTMATEDFQKYAENPQANGMQLFFSGKMKISGDNTKAIKLSALFSLTSY
jgi:putative sterol carrier protein